MNGIINLYKPSGYTSHDAVARIKRFYGTRRVGHAGTLDPMACGVLPILIGSACAAQDYLMNHDKVYLAGMRFGVTTDTGDITGSVLSEKAVALSTEEVAAVLTRFVGKQQQIPPMYSAIKIGGQKLYDLARKGVTVERKAREIEIYGLSLVKAEGPQDFLVKVTCSKGTYVRTLCEDIGDTLGCGGTLFSLERLSCGSFEKQKTVTIEQLQELYEKGDTMGLEALLTPVEAVFGDCPLLSLSPFYAHLCKNGCEIYLKKLPRAAQDFPEGALVRLYDESHTFFALGKVLFFPDGLAVKGVARF